MALIVTILFAFSLGYLFVFSLGQLHLTWIYSRKKNKPGEGLPLTVFPTVTIQLPVYNEKYVVERLLDAVSAIRYPKEKLEVQVLDDSTDETTSLIVAKMKELRPLGVDFKLIHREARTGFKAGALDHGLKLAKGEFVAIFDADFLPSPDFLARTLPYFCDPTIGVIQTRWGHLNRDYSILTQLQAFGLDAHFSVEQSARNEANSFINFNGTCGVWRKATIEDAGGWSFDTLTEDLDLSYRAQLAGWTFKYLEDFSTPGELPVIMPAIKSQQYRWNKGAAETARKVLGNVLRSRVPVRKKVHAAMHLLNSSVFTALLCGAILSIPMLFLKRSHPEFNWIFEAGVIFLIGFLSIALFYWTASKRFYEHPAKSFFRLFPPFLVVSMGLSMHNGLAVIEGLLGIKTPFIRTPKFNIAQKGQTWKGNDYVKPALSPLTILEGLLCLYFIAGIAIGLFWFHDPTLLPFHLMLALGFGSVFFFSIKPVANG